MIGLTEKQKVCLDFIRAHHAETGFMPRYDDLCAGLGLKSRSRVSQLLDDLVERGAIRRIKGRARAIELVDPDEIQSVLLNNEIHALLKQYADSQHVGLDTAANELLRQSLGAAA